MVTPGTDGASLPRSGGADDARYWVWIDWLKVLQNELRHVHLERLLWRETTDAIQKESVGAPGTWFWHYVRVYVASQSMAVRRIVRGDAKRNHISLARLLDEIEKYPEVVPPHRWHEPEPVGQVARRDRNALFRELREVIALADTSVAHIVPVSERIGNVPLGRLDSAIDLAATTFQRYTHALGGQAWAVDESVYALPDWKATFSKPLFHSRGDWHF